MQAHGVPGAAVGVLWGDQEEHATFGVESLSSLRPVNEQSLFQIGSLTKTYTSTVIWHLIDQGALSLDAPVRTWIASARPPRIVSPADGVTVALDPDIPSVNQALIMAAKPAAPELTLQLDGRLLGPLSDHHKWLPTPGRHRLQLIGADGHVLDSVEFSVKAASP
jgi:hypothetical protein